MIRSSAIALTALAFAVPAAAQDAPRAAQPYVGVSGGYHDLFDNPIGKDGGAIGGVVAGVDLALTPEQPTGPVIGVEGNFHLGTGAVDSEYGVAGRVGYRFPSGGLFYARAGYQWVNVDVSKVTGGLVTARELGVDDTDGDYLVGVGGEFTAGRANTRFRIGVDTVSFDSWRPNAAVIFSF